MKKLTAIGVQAALPALGAFTALNAPGALAQDAARSTSTAQGEGLAEVVVTARYREERLQETPIAITAITADEITSRNFTASYELGYTVPNASLRPAHAAFGSTMSAYIRGIGQYDFLPEFEPGVAIYFDDVLHPVTMGSMVDLLDLERVEVLRGPQGTLFGRGAIGGAIRYVSRKPQGDDTGSISVTYGQFDRIDVRASYDFGITDTLFARVTGVSKSREGYQKIIDFACAFPEQAGTLPRRVFNRSSGCQIGTQGGEDVTGARGALRYVPSEGLEFLFTADYLNDESEARADTLVTIARDPATGNLPGPFQAWSNAMEAQFGVPFDERFLPPDIYTSYATYSDPVSGIAFDPVTAVEQWGVSGKADWTINDLVRMEAILSRREFESQFATDADGSPLGEQTVDGRQSFKATTAELRFSGRAMDIVDWTVGYFHYEGDFTSGQQVSIPAFAPGPFLVNGLNITESENNSVFAHTVWDLTDKLAFTAGVRYSEDTKDEQFDNTIVTTTGSAEDSHFDWKVGVDYQFTETLMLYASAATGYRPQAFNPRPFQVTQFVPVDGEEAHSYEIGFKSDLFERRLRLNVAGFFIDYNQRILPVGGTECLANNNGEYVNIVPEGTPGAVQDSLGQWCIDPNGPGALPGAVVSRTFYDNIPAEVSGAEVEFQFRPVAGLTFSGTFGYTDFKGDEFEDPSLLGNPAVTEILSDNPIYVPELNWSVSAAYQFGTPGGASITPRLDFYGQSEICPSIRTNVTPAQVTTTEDQSCTAAYELLNARLEWGSASGLWTAAFGVNNLTNEEYFLNKFDLSAFGQPTVEGQPGRPREWYVQFTRLFE